MYCLKIKTSLACKSIILIFFITTMNALNTSLITLTLCLLVLAVYCNACIRQRNVECDSSERTIGGGLAPVAEALRGDLNMTRGVFTFKASEKLATNIMISVQFIPLGEGALSPMTVDLVEAFRKNMGVYTVRLPSHREYDVRLVNGNLANPLTLKSVTTGSYIFNNDNTVTNEQTGITYSLKSSRQVVTATVDNERQKTLAFTAAYRACPETKLSLNTQETPSSGASDPIPTIRNFMKTMVPVGGP